MQLLETVFGSGTELGAAQMAVRALAVFVIALVMIRLSGRRSFGQHTPFDACTTVLLGAVLSRAVVGASPFGATTAAGFALVLMHRVVAWLSVHFYWFDRLVSGNERVLIDQGEMDSQAMEKALISKRDLGEAIRRKFGTGGLHEIDRAVLERDGTVSLKKKSPESERSADSPR